MTLTTIQNPIVISQYEVLLGDIAEAKTAAVLSFDYETKEGEKAARSYIFQLRKLRARIESARKDAKSYALAYGKRVDEQAKDLSSQVDDLIQPHQQQLDAIAQREAERVAAHQMVLDRAICIGTVSFGEGSMQIKGRLDALDDVSLDGLEEFAERVAAAIVASRKNLQQALQQALQAEERERELAKLKAEEEERQRKENEERIKREAQERADAEAAQAAADSIRDAERRAAKAEAKAAAAEAKAAASLRLITSPRFAAAEDGEAVAPGPDPAGPNPRQRLIAEIRAAIKGMDRQEVAEAIADGTLHHSVRVHWESVQ